MSRSISRFVTLMFFAWMIGSSMEVSAQSSTDEEARLLFEAGRAAFSSGRYEEALARFERAHQLSGRAELLYNIAVSADRLRDDARALEAFRAYLAAMPEAAQREEIEARITILTREVEAAQAAPEPDPASHPDPPPDHPPPPLEIEREPTVHDDTGTSLTIGGGVIAGVGLVAAVVLGVLALGEDDALTRDCGLSCGPGASEGLMTLTIATDASIAIAAVGAVLVTIGLAIELGQGERDVTLAVIPTEGGALLAMRGRLP